MKFLLVIVVLFLFVPSIFARPSIPTIDIVEAGPKPVSQNYKRLRSFRFIEICPGDYTNGYSIRCNVQNNNKSVIFFVEYSEFNRQYKEPYFLAGDNKKRVRPFEMSKHFGRKDVRIACRVRTRRPVWVHLIEKC